MHPNALDPIDQHYENFPVASLLLPKEIRQAVKNLYRFARSADDLADEGDQSTETRQSALQSLQNSLKILEQSPKTYPTDSTPSSEQFILQPLWQTMRQHQLSYVYLHNLLHAFLQDTTITRYSNFESILKYCQYSANPVGRLLLELFETKNTQETLEQSDAVCTALQLINFIQDVLIDWDKGRIYLPLDEWQHHHLDPSIISTLRNGSMSDIIHHQQWQLFMRFQANRAQATLLTGAPLALQIPGRIGWELRLIILGGLRILQKLKACQYDVFFRRPTLQWNDYRLIMWQSLRFSANLKQYKNMG